MVPGVEFDLPVAEIVATPLAALPCTSRSPVIIRPPPSTLTLTSSTVKRAPVAEGFIVIPPLVVVTMPRKMKVPFANAEPTEVPATVT